MVHEIPAVQTDVVGCAEPCVVPAERRDELLFWPEHHAAYRGVRAVGADDEIGVQLGVVGESHFDAVVVLVKF